LQSAPAKKTPQDIRAMITTLYFKLTGIESIDPAIALTDQGLDSMSLTELVSQLEEELKIDLDPDVVFEYPLVDQLVDALDAMLRAH
jgi:acyl carrier protein